MVFIYMLCIGCDQLDERFCKMLKPTETITNNAYWAQLKNG